MRAHAKGRGKDPAIVCTSIDDFYADESTFASPVEPPRTGLKRSCFSQCEIVKRQVPCHPFGLPFFPSEELTGLVGEKREYAALDCTECVAAVGGRVKADPTLRGVEGFCAQAPQDVLGERVLCIAEFAADRLFASLHLLYVSARLQD